jgi:hypothetical protein
LRDHLAASLLPLETSTTTPGELAKALHDFLSESSRNWPLARVTDLFHPPVDRQDVTNVRDIRNYRHQIAHGISPPTSIEPHLAHGHLTAFLQKAGLL